MNHIRLRTPPERPIVGSWERIVELRREAVCLPFLSFPECLLMAADVEHTTLGQTAFWSETLFAVIVCGIMQPKF